MLYRGQKEALVEFLPLDAQNWITCGNALRLELVEHLPPTGQASNIMLMTCFIRPLIKPRSTSRTRAGRRISAAILRMLGSTWQSTEQKEDLQSISKGARTVGSHSTMWRAGS